MELRDDFWCNVLLHFRALIWCEWVNITSARYFLVITFLVTRRERVLYCGHVCLCVYLSMSACSHYCTYPDVTWGSGRGCPVVVHFWVDLQSVHGLRCYGNLTRTRNVNEYMLVLALCLVCLLVIKDDIHGLTSGKVSGYTNILRRSLPRIKQTYNFSVSI